MPGAIIVHGGAGNIPPGLAERYSAGCKEAALVGWGILQAGGSALDAVEAAVRSLEDNPYYSRFAHFSRQLARLRLHWRHGRN